MFRRIILEWEGAKKAKSISPAEYLNVPPPQNTKQLSPPVQLDGGVRSVRGWRGETDARKGVGYGRGCREEVVASGAD